MHGSYFIDGQVADCFLLRFREFGLRPPIRPRARAAATPSLGLAAVREWLSSAKAATMVEKSLPSGVVVLMLCSRTSGATFFSCSSDAISRRSLVERLTRSRRVAANRSPSRICSRSLSSSGWGASVPVIFSMKPVFAPAAVRAPAYSSRLWSTVETRPHPTG